MVQNGEKRKCSVILIVVRWRSENQNCFAWSVCSWQSIENEYLELVGQRFWGNGDAVVGPNILDCI